MSDFLISLLGSGVEQAAPLLIVTLGEIVSERSGVLNLGLEGMMLLGAFFGFWASVASGSLLIGCLAAAGVGIAAAAVHALLCVLLRANQVVSGLALTVFGGGLAAFLGGREITNMIMEPARTVFTDLPVPVLSRIPALGPVLFSRSVPVYLALLALPAVAFVLNRTRIGLNIRSVGENPAAADALGINVNLTRSLCVLFGGAMAGLAGAFLSLELSPGWKEGMTGGRGWVAVALVIFGSWRGGRAALGALLFGTLYTLDSRLQARGTVIPTHFLQMLPYASVILFLVAARSRAFRRTMSAPEALGLPYRRGQRD